MTSILSRQNWVFNIANSNYVISETENIFWIFFSISEIYIIFWNIWKKKHDPHRWCISEIIDSKKRCYLNALEGPNENTYQQSTC